MRYCLALLVLFSASGLSAAVRVPAVQRIGDVAEDNGVLAAAGKSALIVMGDASATVYRLTADLQLAPAGQEIQVVIMPHVPGDLSKGGLGRVGIRRDKEGTALRATATGFNEATKQWAKGGGQAMTFTFWPAAAKKPKVAEAAKPSKGERAAKALAEANIEERSWRGQWLGLEVVAGRKSVAVWLDGRIVHEFARPAGATGPVAVQLCQGDRLRSIALTAPDPIYLPLDVGAYANDRFEKPFAHPRAEVGGVPFEFAGTEQNSLTLRQAQWLGWEQDLPWSHESPAPRMLNDPRMPLLRVGAADYVAAHVLAVADDDPALSAAFTLRAGRFSTSGNEPNVQYDFRGEVPRRGEAAKVDANARVQTAAGPLFCVRVPMTLAFAQDFGEFIEIEVTKDVRLARRVPDPCRYRYRPLGLPSGARIAAITLEKSPLQMRVSSSETGHAFVEPKQPEFKVSLENITAATQEYALKIHATHLEGTKVEAAKSGKVEAGKTAEVTFPLTVSLRGYYDLAVTLEDGKKRTLLRRETSFALLPPDTRKHRDQSPFGTYDYGGAHYTCRDRDTVGPLYVKMGMRYGMFGAPPQMRRKYGLVKGNEPRVSAYDKVLAANPDLPPMALIFHEACISGKHIMRVPDLFVDWPPYKLDEKEEASLKKMWDDAAAGAAAVRQKHPEVKMAFGNGPLPTKEEFLRHKFPADLFDSAGNECGALGHLPESQPPDWIGNNASLWMDRQMLDAYGYKDKPVTQCHEVCYPSTNPGNLDYRTQADYFVRHAMHSLAWGVPAFRPGVLMDVGGNYRYSHWGSSGFCHMYPEMNVKPAFVAFATMTLVLDGAKFARVVPTRSASLYVEEFDKADDGSRVFVIWTIRGARPVGLKLEGAGPWKLIDAQANETTLKAEGGKYGVTASSSPVYVVGKGVLAAVEMGPPQYADKPEGKVTVISPLASLEGWSVENGRSPELEYYDFMTPRRKGDFMFEAVTQFNGKTDALRVTPKPITRGKDTMSMYAVLAHKSGLPLPGTPTEIGLWVNGNSGWGRVIFDLVDASGQRWVSIGAPAKDDPATILPKWILDQFPSPTLSDWSTDDPWGVSRINFDGWRYVGFPMPGNYPGEGYAWPANSNWRWDKDGKVHYPLTLKKLVVELNEKVLQVKTFAPVARPEIYLKDLQVAEGDTVKVKPGVRE